MAILRVPTDHPSIQAAIDAAVTDDTIIIEAGFTSDAPATVTKKLTIEGLAATTGIVLTMSADAGALNLTGTTAFEVIGSIWSDYIRANDANHILNGGDNFDILQLDLEADSNDILFDASQFLGGTTTLGGAVVSGFEAIVLRTGAGNDTFELDDAAFEPIVWWPLAVIVVPPITLSPNPILFAGIGDDFLSLNAGTEGLIEFHGDGGNDSIIADFTGVEAPVALTSDAMHDGSLVIGDVIYPGNLRIDFSSVENFHITGGLGDDSLLGASLNDIFDGGAGRDYLYGEEGIDILAGGEGDDYLDGGMGNDTITGGDGNDFIYDYFSRLVPGDDNDVLDGGAGDFDHIRSLRGVDIIDGGAGVGDSVVITRGLSTTDLTFTLTNSSSITTLVGDGTTVVNVESFWIAGGSGNDLFIVGSSDDYLSGGNGEDELHGMDGDDEIYGGGGSDRIFGGAGNDWLHGWTDYFEDDDDDLFDLIDGGEGDDTLSGAWGNDLLYGGAGNDAVSGNEDDDLIDGGDGNDYLQGDTGNDMMFGGDGNDSLVGALGNDTLTGGSGIDTAFYFVSTSAVSVSLLLTSWQDTSGEGIDILTSIENLTGSDYSDTLTGNNDDNVINGRRGNDTINGRGGADTMIGGAGNDRFYVDHVNDVVTEATNQGTDRVYVSVGYTLGAGQSIEYLYANAGSTGLVLHGNELANNIQGNAGVDTLFGHDGNDILDGRGGADDMTGGGGNDKYYIDHAGDAIHEASAEGSLDMAYASVDYTLGANVYVERLYANSSTSLTLQGNDFANALFGNAGNDTLMGHAGSDTLTGNAGNDRLMGGAGIDTLFGKAGNDIFVLQNLAADRDAIRDFVAGDRIEVSASLFGGGLVAGALAANQFVSNATGVAGDSDDRFIYNTTNGALYFDIDGDGAAARVQIATLSGLPGLTAADFTIAA